MNLVVTNEERNVLVACINLAVKQSDNALQTAAQLLPLAQKLVDLKEEAPKAE